MNEYAVVRRSSQPGGVMQKRVVVVDDSAVMRAWLRHVLNNDDRIEVVGEASDAHEARALIKRTEPDVITLDIEMPGMDGLEFLDRLMRLKPLPVVMISSATRRGSEAAVKALSLGAVDCVLKPDNGSDPDVRRDLVRRVFSAACSSVTAQPIASRTVTAPLDRARGIASPVILLGASTGGVTALETVLRGLHPDGPPVVIVQHMPGTFLVSFTKMLNKMLPQNVGFLRPDQAIEEGDVMLAPAFGMQHSGVTRVQGQWVCTQTPAEGKALYCPSVDALFSSATDEAPDVIAAILTGLGRDGAQGLLALRQAGARTVGQDAASCVVYGMPRAAHALGAVEAQVPLAQIAPQINTLVEAHAKGRKAGQS